MGGLFHKLRHPRRCYVVCTIPRSGSNLLTDGLRATRKAGMPKQFFLPKSEDRYGAELGLDPNADYPGYVRGIVDAKITRNEVFGFKLMSWYLDDFLARLRITAFGDAATDDLTMLRNAFPRIRFVHILRHHKLRQALSTARALQTGLWKVQEGKNRVTRTAIRCAVDRAVSKRSRATGKYLARIFSANRYRSPHVEYEELCRGYEATIRGVLDFLKISLPRNARIGPPVTIRQADEISRVWGVALPDRASFRVLASAWINPNVMLNPNEKVEPINVAEEVSRSFLDYSMSVIISRALPDARDGLKPSQRRILYAMHDLSLFPGRQHRKCAKICGDTSGNYHPHGEAVIYPTLVHMAQPWAMREPLVDGQGNFGSVEGDPPAAMRYTEARMTPLGAALMTDMEKDTVDFVPNYDETRTEPTVFPAAFPNLLVNGGTGIAVGMATNIPPHNLSEVIDGICAQIDDRKSRSRS